MEWISVEDELPPEDSEVIAFSVHEGVVIAKRWETLWYYNETDDYVGTVTHWMFFPEPPA